METMLDSTPGYSMECLVPGDRQAYVAAYSLLLSTVSSLPR